MEQNGPYKYSKKLTEEQGRGRPVGICPEPDCNGTVVQKPTEELRQPIISEYYIAANTATPTLKCTDCERSMINDDQNPQLEELINRWEESDHTDTTEESGKEETLPFYKNINGREHLQEDCPKCGSNTLYYHDKKEKRSLFGGLITYEYTFGNNEDEPVCYYGCDNCGYLEPTTSEDPDRK